MGNVMKTKHLFLGIFFIAGSVTLSYGQDDIKEWKQKLKQLSPEQYKQMVEENNTLQKQLSEAKAESDHFRNESAAKDAEIQKLKSDLEASRSASAATATTAKTAVAVKPAGTTGNNATASAKPAHQSTAADGVTYKVQIGAFKNKDLLKYLQNHKNFSGDVDNDGTRKYTLGEFNDYWEADRFKKYLREMGVKDAWIVSYKDGKRVPIKDALEGLL
jgi:cell division protein FtsN